MHFMEMLFFSWDIRGKSISSLRTGSPLGHSDVNSLRSRAHGMQARAPLAQVADKTARYLWDVGLNVAVDFILISPRVAFEGFSTFYQWKLIKTGSHKVRSGNKLGTSTIFVNCLSLFTFDNTVSIQSRFPGLP